MKNDLRKANISIAQLGWASLFALIEMVKILFFSNDSTTIWLQNGEPIEASKINTKGDFIVAKRGRRIGRALKIGVKPAKY